MISLVYVGSVFFFASIHGVGDVCVAVAVVSSAAIAVAAQISLTTMVICRCRFTAPVLCVQCLPLVRQIHSWGRILSYQIAKRVHLLIRNWRRLLNSSYSCCSALATGVYSHSFSFWLSEKTIILF